MLRPASLKILRRFNASPWGKPVASRAFDIDFPPKCPVDLKSLGPDRKILDTACSQSQDSARGNRLQDLSIIIAGAGHGPEGLSRSVLQRCEEELERIESD